MEHLATRQKVIIMLAIISATMFVGLNMTLLNTALPRIVSDLGGMEYFSWIFTTFMLASSITSILVGKLSDIYGRKPFILAGLFVFITGTLLAGFSQNIIHLISCRGIQGFGGGMIMSTSFSAVGDLFPPRDRARWQGLMSAAFGVTSVLGPTLGGYLVDNINWRWNFWVFIPFGITAFLLIFKLFPSVSGKEKEEVDYLGSILLTIFMVSFLLSFSWGGTRYSWLSWEILGLLLLSVLVFIAFILVQKRVKSPIIPLFLFKNRIFLITNMAGFFMGIGIFCTTMYMPFFIQGVFGASATVSGFVIMPLTFVMMTFSVLTGQIITKTGKYKKLALLGLVLMAVGLFVTASMDLNSHIMTGAVTMAIVGLGIGLSLPVFSLTVQNAVQHSYLGVATATFQMARQIGGTIGVALLNIVMNRRFAHQIEVLFQQAELARLWQAEPEVAHVLQALTNPQVLMNPARLLEIESSLPFQLQESFAGMIELLRGAFNYSLSGVFFFEGMLVVLALIVACFLEEIPLRTSNEP